MGKIADNVVGIIGKLAGKATAEEEITAVGTLDTLQKEARKALRESATWNQEFHGNELAAVIAMLIASRQVLSDKEAALSRAIMFIGSFEHDDQYGQKALNVLEDINQLLVGETISESMKKQVK